MYYYHVNLPICSRETLKGDESLSGFSNVCVVLIL